MTQNDDDRLVPALLATGDERAQVIEVLRNSLYPGAKTESVEMVLAYCRANRLDPFNKPVHIVPTSVKVQSNPDKWETRDVLMPGISDYRTKAARSGAYCGKSEPEFGPTVTETLGGVEMKYPAWCKVTIERIVGGQPRRFAATEYWLENYATAGRNTAAPNAMWKKRPFGQLAKCVEAQSLRMAFPEYGGAPTAEELEGKEVFAGTTIDQAPPRQAVPPDKPSEDRTPIAERMVVAVARIDTLAELQRFTAVASVVQNRDWFRAHQPELADRVDEAVAAALARHTAPPPREREPGADDDFPGEEAAA